MINLYSLYCKTLKQFYSPFCDKDDDSVRRNFYDVVNDSKDNMIKRAPLNYAIYKVAEFDHKTGVVNACNPVVVIECAELQEVAGGN